jgi:uncharacterized protein (TIGR00266 family)
MEGLLSMEITLRHTPSFGVARLMLTANEAVKVEAGAMYAMSAGVTLESKMDGGFMKSAKRAMLGGESFFVTSYTAPAQGGFVDVAARLPGDLLTKDITPDNALFVQKGSWLASSSTVEVDTKWGGFKNMFGSEGAFILRASGSGHLVMSCYGALETWDLQPGQTLTVDTGHMVAYEESVQLQIRKATGGLVQSFKSGEGLVFDFVGPGKVMTQTRNPNELLGWISATLGTGNSGSAAPGGMLGGVFGRD